MPHLRRDLPYDPLRDFEAVTLVASFPNLLVVRPAVPATDVRQLIDLLRANPGKYSYASSGFGASPHLSAEWFKLVTKTDVLHVPFTGSAPALPALLGGHVDLMFDTLPSVLPLVQEGKLRALGVTTAERVPFLPSIPAIAETLPDFDVTSWLGVVVPAGTPAEIRARIAAPLAEFIREPAVVARLRDVGAVAAKPNTPEEFAAVDAQGPRQVGPRRARDRDQARQLTNGAVGGIRTRDLRSEIPGSWTARRRQRDQEDQHAKMAPGAGLEPAGLAAPD